MFKPKQYQILAITAGMNALQKTSRALINMATGLGKTVVSAFIAKKMKINRALFLVHNNFILEKAMETYKNVIPDKSMIIFNGVTKQGAKEADFVFSTWQTMQRSMINWDEDYFDLIIIDEAHHTEANSWKEVAKYFNGMKLGLTATPDRMDRLDIRTTFGNEVFELTLERAIARGFLPKIEYHVITDNLINKDAFEALIAQIKAEHCKPSMSEINRRLFINKHDSEVASIINSYPQKAVIFCASILHANRLVTELKLADTFHSKRYGNSEVAHSAASIYKANRQVLIDLENGNIQRVCAVNAFNEGVDVPSIGLVAFCRVTSSETIFRQQLGRGLRPGKDTLIVLDFVSNLERIKQIKKFERDIEEEVKKVMLEEESEEDKEENVKPHIMISGKGFEFIFDDRIVNIMDELEQLTRKSFYDTWQEASMAALTLGIKTSTEYSALRHNDKNLHSLPSEYYADFPGWHIFLNKKRKEKKLSTPKPKKYKTLEQISKAAIALKIKTSTEYILRYKEDPMLPCTPDRIAGFVSWTKLLQTEKYQTWQEASNAAIAIGVTKVKEYRNKYRQDNRLPSNPYRTYSDFPGWVKFLKG